MTRVTEAVEEADRLRLLATDLAHQYHVFHLHRCRWCTAGMSPDDCPTARLLTRARTELGLS